MSAKAPILIDTNVLILLIAGSVDPRLIDVHKNCSAFTRDDYTTLLDHLGNDPRFVLLPNIVTEASNLLRQIGDPYRTALAEALAGFIFGRREDYVSSQAAASHPSYRRLGIADCAVLETVGEDIHLLTVDLDLYLAFLGAGRPATNFRHVIDRAG